MNDTATRKNGRRSTSADRKGSGLVRLPSADELSTRPQYYLVTVEGTSPLLMNAPNGLRPAGARVGKIPTAADEAELGVYRDAENGNRIYFPNDAFVSATITAGKGEKIGKVGVMTVLKSSVFSGQDKADLFDPGTRKPFEKYEIDTRRAVPQKGAVLRSRPIFYRWGAQFGLEVYSSAISEERLGYYIVMAGLKVGVGNFRPEKGGPFGRYRVVEMARIENTEE